MLSQGKCSSGLENARMGKRYNDRDKIIENCSRNEQALNHGG